jgi:tetratricopeptide (TPR) repeat protein
MKLSAPDLSSYLRPETGLALLVYGLPIAFPVALLLLYVWKGRGPRRRRALRRGQRCLAQKAWREALAIVEEIKKLGRLSPAWEGRVRNLEGECHRLAAEDALLDNRFEESLERTQLAARLLAISDKEGKRKVIEVMLAELRRLFATQSSAAPALAMAERVLALEPDCAEAQFWLGLAHVRESRTEAALEGFRRADVSERERAQERGGPRIRALDPLLYLGALLLRETRIADALRHLSEAYRLWPECPFVAWQLGVAIVANGGDSLAVRALQKALGPTGLPSWDRDPQRGWVEGLPPVHRNGTEEFPGSFVRRLAVEHTFHCPVLGHDVPAMIRQGKVALAQAHYRLGRYAEAADLFQSVLADSPPTLVVLRGLGMALVRQELFDQAFKHLRAAYEIESTQPTDRTYQSAAYLALCGAKGKPYRPEDKINNVVWAIALLLRFDVKGDAEWARICSAVFAEARAHHIGVAANDQLRLCDTLASVAATDPEAAEAYEELFASAPELVKSEHAWLYARAAQQHGVGGMRGLPLLMQTCREDSGAETYFFQHDWDFGEVVYTFLHRLAASREQAAKEGTPLPLEFALTPGQGDRLLERSRAREAAGDDAGAVAAAEVLLTLAPDDRRVPDRLAELHYRKGNLTRAAACLFRLSTLEPNDPPPLLRRAVIEQQRGNEAGAFEAIERACGLLAGKARASAAFLGARLALAAYFNTPDRRPGHPAWDRAKVFLDSCLRDDPEHVDARWCMAALHAGVGDRAALAALAPTMTQEATQGVFQYLSATAHLAANAPGDAESAARRAAASVPSPSPEDMAESLSGRLALDIEAEYLVGLARLQQGDRAGATESLRRVAGTASPSADHARAALGRMEFERGDHDAAVLWWSAVEASKRAAWRLDVPLRDTVALTALNALANGRYEVAIDRLREAERLGWRDARLPALLTQARVKAGQIHLAYAAQLADPNVPTATPLDENGEAAPLDRADLALARSHAAETAAWLFKAAVHAGCHDPNVAHLLARAYKIQGNTLECRNALRQIQPPDIFASLQLGLLALRETKGGFTSPLVEAEREFAQAWKTHEAASALGNGSGPSAETQAAFAAGFNLLLCRLSQGKCAEAREGIPRLLDVTFGEDERRTLALLHATIEGMLAKSEAGPQLLELSVMPDAEEESLLRLVRGLGHIETSAGLLQTLHAARPRSETISDAGSQAQMLRAKQCLDRGDASAAERILAPLVYERARRPRLADGSHPALVNLLGCAECLLQDFEGAVRHFNDALQLSGNADPRLHQNQALAYEFLRQHMAAERAWDRYLDRTSPNLPAPPGRPDYVSRLTLECLLRLASRNYEGEHWETARNYYQRALPLKPDDPDILERLFHVNNQLRRAADARQVLEQLRQVRAGAPQLELYELEVNEVRTADDVLRLLGEVEHVVRKYPQDAAVAERAAGILANLISFMASLEKQYRQQLRKTERSLEELPSYQVNWPEVHGYLRDVRSRLAKLRRAADRCIGMATLDRHRRSLHQLRQNIEADFERCRELAG